MINKLITFIRNTILEVRAVKYISRRQVVTNTLQITVFLVVSLTVIVLLDSVIQSFRQAIIFI